MTVYLVSKYKPFVTASSHSGSTNSLSNKALANNNVMRVTKTRGGKQQAETGQTMACRGWCLINSRIDGRGRLRGCTGGTRRSSTVEMRASPWRHPCYYCSPSPPSAPTTLVCHVTITPHPPKHKLWLEYKNRTKMLTIENINLIEFTLNKFILKHIITIFYIIN